MDKTQEIIEWVNATLDDIHSRAETMAMYDLPKFVDHLKKDFLARFAPKPMTFMEAVAAMKEGKKVRRRVWKDGIYICYDTSNDNKVIEFRDGKQREGNTAMFHDDFTTADWQII